MNMNLPDHTILLFHNVICPASEINAAVCKNQIKDSPKTHWNLISQDDVFLSNIHFK